MGADRCLCNIQYRHHVLLRRDRTATVGKIDGKGIDFVCEDHGNRRYIQAAYLPGMKRRTAPGFPPGAVLPSKNYNHLVNPSLSAPADYTPPAFFDPIYSLFGPGMHPGMV